MKTVLKWIGIAAAILVVLVALIGATRYIYEPRTHAGWIKPGIPHRKLPAGVNTTVAFENVSVIPMDGERILEGQTVVIEDQRVTKLGPSENVDVPTGAHVVDAAGKYLIPGLSDMHVHTEASENSLLVYLANGVTTVRSMGGEAPVVLKWRDQIRAGTRVGPSIWAWWPLIEGNQLWPERDVEWATRGGQSWVHTPEEAAQMVAEMAALGVDGIKTHVVDSSDVYRALLASAARHGLPIDGHVPTDHNFCPDNENVECACATRQECWNDFRTMGAPAVAHAEELIKVVDWSDESIRQAAQDVSEDGLWVTTTADLMRAIADQAADIEGTLASAQHLEYVHPRVFDSKRWGPETNEYARKIEMPGFLDYVAAVEKMLLALDESGARLLAGTDAPVPVMVPGFSLHDELETLADIGLSPYDVLRTSTTNPALYFGEGDEAGTVEVGKRADLVLLDANPLEDITNTRRIAGTMVRGRWYDRADLDRMLELVARDYKTANTTWAIIRIAFPTVVVLIPAALVWLGVARWRRRRKATPSS
jgi:imidazolonepropionase-like amidohydrolase